MFEIRHSHVNEYNSIFLEIITVHGGIRFIWKSEKAEEDSAQLVEIRLFSKKKSLHSSDIFFFFSELVKYAYVFPW